MALNQWYYLLGIVGISLLILLLTGCVVSRRPHAQTERSAMQLRCQVTVFENQHAEPWILRDFEEFLAVQSNNRCRVRTSLPCIVKFVKQQFDLPGPRRYHVRCGAESAPR